MRIKCREAIKLDSLQVTTYIVANFEMKITCDDGRVSIHRLIDKLTYLLQVIQYSCI